MIKENIASINKRIAVSLARAGRDPACVMLVAVTKARPAEQIRQVIEAGITDIGENRLQEALVKYGKLEGVKWHMVGHLQANKVKEAVKIFDLIHSVDSLRLASAIDKHAYAINKTQDILVQVNTSGEPSKSGIKPDEAVEVIQGISRLRNINLKGLMTIAPVADNPEEVRPYFRELKGLLDKLNRQAVTRQPLHALSMGMTDDFEAAIEEGSTIIRLGRAIFEG